MISTYRYAGQRTVEKDGQKSTIPVKPQLVLNQAGAFIQVTITHPRIIQEEFKRRPVYYAFIVFPWGSGKEIPIVACPLRRFDCLIGRDILMHWHLSYNGPDGSIVICD